MNRQFAKGLLAAAVAVVMLAVFIAVSIEHFAQHGAPGAVQDLLDRLTSALDHDGPDRPSPHPPDR